MSRAVLAAAGAALLFAAAGVHGQEVRGRWELAALPSIGYDSDEGFRYGALAEVYRHAPGISPYAWTVQPIIEFSTRGRREISAFFDAPHLLPAGWRIDGTVANMRELAAPWYGAGNDTPWDEARDDADGPDPYYYRFGRTSTRAMATVQRRLGAWPVRLLAGAGVARVSLDTTPYDEGTTLLAETLAADGASVPGGWSNHVRAGVVLDTRDREVGPTRGAWSEVLVQRFDALLGSDHEYTRWTAADRRYIALGTERLVFANRLMLQGIRGDAPFYDLSTVQTSFKQQEGLGGAKTIRGIPKNRYVGKGLFLWNAELRWRAADFEVRGTPLHLVLTGFVDQGRVWEGDAAPAEAFSDLHRGYGGGVRLGRGNFVLALDVGHSAEATAPFYIGLGYLF
jgi:hypothetical protein